MNKIEKTLSSLEVAEMVEKEHSKLLKDIRRYMEQLGEANIGFTDFFQESNYISEQNKALPCYKITEKGCEFIANKLTGVKGTAFTARYVNRFHDMEDTIREHKPPVQELSPQLQFLINMELRQKEQDIKLNALDSKIDSIKNVVALNPNDWRKDSGKIINKVAQSMGGYEHIKPIREESYKLLEQRMGVALNIRLTNKKKTMSLNGVCRSKVNKLNQLDVIADDKKLIEGYIAIIKDLAIKYGVANQEVA